MTHGILLLDKPLGLSSNAAVQRVRRAFGRVKAGHTGSLDPLATGMLPVCLGEATKVAGYLLEGDKQYEFTIGLGVRTATGDREGEVVERCAVPTDCAAVLAAALPAFRGEITQVPPMYSALKRDGQPLYKLARQGIEVVREPRAVTIHDLALISVNAGEAKLSVRCSKGTYVRTLAEDIARAAGTCGHLTALRRTIVAPFDQVAMVTLEEVESHPAGCQLLSADTALVHLAAISLDADSSRRLRQGQAVGCPGQLPAAALLRVYGPAGQFLGIGRTESVDAAVSILKPVRLFNDLDANPT